MDINLFTKTKRIIEGIPNTNIPMLDALGSPSKTELADHAIQNINRNIPIPILAHAPALNEYFLL
jgi:hypothetical protein